MSRASKFVLGYLMLAAVGMLLMAFTPKPTLEEHKANLAVQRAQRINEAKEIFETWCASRPEATPACDP